MRPVNNYLFIEEVEQAEMKAKDANGTTAVLYVPPTENPDVREYRVIKSNSLKQFPISSRVLVEVKSVIDVQGWKAVKEESVIAVRDIDA